MDGAAMGGERYYYGLKEVKTSEEGKKRTLMD